MIDLSLPTCPEVAPRIVGFGDTELLAEPVLGLIAYRGCPAEVRRTTSETALARNHMVLAPSHEVVAPYVAKGSPLALLLRERANNE